MKQWIWVLLVSLLFGTKLLLAADSGSAHRSSFTATNDSVYISSSIALTAILVSSPTPGGAGIVGIYNSTWSTAPSLLIGSVSLATAMYYEYFDMPVRGVFYKAVGNLSGFTIIYQR